MRPVLFALLGVTLSFLPAVSADVQEKASSRTHPFDHGLLDGVLQTYVDSLGRVDYRALSQHRQALDAYADSLAAVSPRSHPRRFPTADDRLSYWINGYNASVLAGVLSAYPVASVTKIKEEGWFFRQQTFAMGGESLTLDHIENRIIRPEFGDARIHFAVNCAAASCPPLENRAFQASTLQERLEAAARRFARSREHVNVERQKNRVQLSQILNWFAQDFTAADAEPGAPSRAIDYLMQYLNERDGEYLREHPDIEVVFNDYDWALNDRPAQD